MSDEEIIQELDLIEDKIDRLTNKLETLSKVDTSSNNLTALEIISLLLPFIVAVIVYLK